VKLVNVHAIAIWSIFVINYDYIKNKKSQL